MASRARSLPVEQLHLERRIRIEAALDQGHGSGALLNPAIGKVVEHALLHFDAERYRMHAWSIMPNHVHVLVTPLSEWTLSSITHAWKSFTANKVNALQNREGKFWAQEYFDRAIRDETHYATALNYIGMNPVKAGLCARPEDWRFSSSWSGNRL